VDAAFQRAIRLDPRNAEAYHQYGYLLLMGGRDSSAEVMYQRALALEPERPITLVTLGFSRHLHGRDREARALCDSAIALVPDAAWAYARRSLWRPRSDVAGALSDAQTAARLAPADYPIEAEAALAAAEFRNGDTASARARLARVAGMFTTGGSQGTYFVSIAFAIAGDADGAIATLQRMVPQGAFRWRIMRDPWFDGIRNDPRFRALAEQSRPPSPED
jgi:Flp pilus assembly protein TadD